MLCLSFSKRLRDEAKVGFFHLLIQTRIKTSSYWILRFALDFLVLLTSVIIGGTTYILLNKDGDIFDNGMYTIHSNVNAI